MVNLPARKRIILFKLRFNRGEPAPPHRFLMDWMGATEIHPLPAVNGILCSLPPSISDEEIMATGGVAAVEKNFKIKLNSYEVVPFYHSWPEGNQYIPQGIRILEAPEFWPRTKGQGVRVAVMDTGIDGQHPDLLPNLKGGMNFIYPGKAFADDNGHGTHVAGIIAAADRGQGIVGMAPEAQLYAAKVLDQRGEGTVYHVISAIHWCVKNKINIVNMSFVLDSYSGALKEALRCAREQGLLVVAAANNELVGEASYPAVFEETVGVKSIGADPPMAGLNQDESGIDFAGPGNSVVSTYRWGTYACLTGNSMAGAYISGLAALLKADHPGKGVGKLYRRLKERLAVPHRVPTKKLQVQGLSG